MKLLDKMKLIEKQKIQEEDREAFRKNLQILFDYEISSQKAMIEALLSSQTSFEISVKICWLMIDLPRKTTIPVMKKILNNDFNISVKIAACEVLGFFRSKSSVPIFIKIASDEQNLEMRRIAIYHLGRILDKRAIDPLTLLLGKPEEDIDILIETLETLAYLNARNATPIILNFLKHPLAKVRFWAVFALSHLGDLDVLPYLEKLLNDSEEVEGWWSVSQEARNAITYILTRN